MSAICDGGSGARLYIPETAVKPLGQPEKVGEHVTRDIWETAAALTAGNWRGKQPKFHH